MKNIGLIQSVVWEKIREATRDGDSASLPMLGKIAEEMDRKHDEWQRLVDSLAKPGPENGSAGSPAPPSNSPPSAPTRARVPEDYSGRSIRGFEIAGKAVAVGSYKELLLALIKILQERDLDRFEAVAPQVRGRGPYFSERPDELRLPTRLSRGKFFVETNLNANLIVAICRRLAEVFGEDLKLDVVPFRTRLQKGSRTRGVPIDDY
jgi:hypothetical protein